MCVCVCRRSEGCCPRRAAWLRPVQCLRALQQLGAPHGLVIGGPQAVLTSPTHTCINFRAQSLRTQPLIISQSGIWTQRHCPFLREMLVEPSLWPLFLHPTCLKKKLQIILNWKSTCKHPLFSHPLSCSFAVVRNLTGFYIFLFVPYLFRGWGGKQINKPI